MARVRAESSRAPAGRAIRLSRAAPWGSCRRTREVRPSTHHPSTRAMRGSQPGVTEMHRGASTRGTEHQKANQKERRRTMPRPSRAPRGTVTSSTSRVAAAVQVSAGSSAAGWIMPSSPRLRQKVLTTEQRTDTSPRARPSHIRHRAAPHSPAHTARGRAHHRRGRDHTARKIRAHRAHPAYTRGRDTSRVKAVQKLPTAPASTRKSSTPSPSSTRGPRFRGAGRGLRIFSRLIVRPLPGRWR